jgi:DNA repair exonuclease SbcCD ATPase subunit
VVEVAGVEYAVVRARPRGVVFRKGTDVIGITQDGWERILGLNYDQFRLSMYAAQGGSTRFLSVNDADKKQFLLQLMNIEEFSSCKTIADVKVKNLELQLVAEQSKRRVIESKIDIYQESLVDDNVYNHAIAECSKFIAELTKALVEAQAVPRPDLSKYLKLEEDILFKRNEFVAVRARREMLHESYKKLAAKNANTPELLDTCRSCGNRIDTTAAKAAHERELEERRAEMAEIKRGIDDCDSTLTREARVRDVSNQVRDRKTSESAEYESAKQLANDTTTKIALKQRELKELSLKLQNNSNLHNKISDLVAEREAVSVIESSVLKDIELYKTVSAMYSSTGAQAYILDSVIDSFNEKVKDYVGFLWSNMTYELQSYKETVKGDVTAKFSEHLVMDGKPISIGSLSGGEFRALSLCVDFALVDVMERQFGLSLSPIILDEPFDGLDGAGREFVIELLEKFSTDRQVVVIDHASEVKSMFSKVISVEKRNGVSSISHQL